MTSRKLDELEEGDQDGKDFSVLHAVTRHHGILMLLAWAVLIPISIACSSLLRRRDDLASPSLVFFRVHYVIAGAGIVVAIAGWVIGFRQFDTLNVGPSWSKAYVHGILGTLVMCAAVLNALAYPFMGKPIEANRSSSKKMVALLHRYLGYGLVILGWITCYLGTRITWVYDSAFLLGFVGCLVAVSLGILVLFRKSQSQPGATQDEQQQLLP